VEETIDKGGPEEAAGAQPATAETGEPEQANARRPGVGLGQPLTGTPAGEPPMT
jgi:hypothetical protein